MFSLPIWRLTFLMLVANEENLGTLAPVSGPISFPETLVKPYGSYDIFSLQKLLNKPEHWATLLS